MTIKNIFAAILFLSSVSVNAQKLSTVNPVIDCGQVIFKAPVTAEFEMRNDGDKPLKIDKVLTSCGCTTVKFPKQEIPAGQKFIVSTTYDAKQMGHFQKQLELFSNASTTPMLLSIRGVVVPELTDFKGKYDYRLGNLMVDINNVEFDNVNRGDRPYAKIHIKNIGTNTAQPVIMHLPDYLYAEISPSKLLPGHSGIATLFLNSQKLRDLGLTQTSVYLGSFLGDKVAPEKEITVSTVLLPDFDKLTTTQRQNAPKLRLSASSLELGQVDGHAVKRGTIIISNEGYSPLKIRSLQMFTAGLSVSLNKTEIAPGSKAKLKINADLPLLKKARSKPRVLIITNDPDNTKAVININIQ